MTESTIIIVNTIQWHENVPDDEMVVELCCFIDSVGLAEEFEAYYKTYKEYLRELEEDEHEEQV